MSAETKRKSKAGRQGAPRGPRTSAQARALNQNIELNLIKQCRWRNLSSGAPVGGFHLRPGGNCLSFIGLVASCTNVYGVIDGTVDGWAQEVTRYLRGWRGITASAGGV